MGETPKKKDGITDGIEILLKRTSLDYNDSKIDDEGLEYGEPLYNANDGKLKYGSITVGKNSKNPSELPVFKAFDRNTVDRIAFHSDKVVTSTTVQLMNLLDESGTLFYPLSKQWTTISSTGITTTSTGSNTLLDYDGTWYKVTSSGISTTETTTTPPMAQKISIPGITKDFQVIICNILSDADRADKQVSKNRRKAFGCLTDVVTYGDSATNGGIWVICSNKAPKADCQIHAFGGFIGGRSIVIGGSGSAFDQTGDYDQFVYVNTPEEGEDLVATTATIGTATQPIYMNEGHIKPLSGNVGSDIKPIYLNNGTLTAFNSTIGDGTSLICINNGSFEMSDSTVGGATDGNYSTYLQNGTITKFTGTLANDISGNADTVTHEEGNNFNVAGYGKDLLVTDTKSIIGQIDGFYVVDSEKLINIGVNTSNTYYLHISNGIGTGNRYYTIRLNSSAIYESVTFETSTELIANLKSTCGISIDSYQTDTTGAAWLSFTTQIYDKLMYNTSVTVNSNNVLMGAGWNDFAEFRYCKEEPGTCVVENGDGTLVKSTKRLQKGGLIVSDTFGMIIGPNNENTKATAIAGRVLAKVNDRRKLKVGDVVCPDKNGTISKMSRLEIILFPDRIIGTISEIPTYEMWNKKVVVNDRVWIKVR